MFNLIPISLLIMALGGIIYIVSDHLSEFSAKGGSPEGGEDEEDESSFGIKTKLAGWINQLPLDNIKAQSLSLTQKLLHRTRIILLKTDNHLMKLISKISEKDKAINGKSDADFWGDFSNDDKKVSPEQIPEPKLEAKIDLTFKSSPETEKFFDIKPAVKTVKTRKSSKTTPM